MEIWTLRRSIRLVILRRNWKSIKKLPNWQTNFDCTSNSVRLRLPSRATKNKSRRCFKNFLNSKPSTIKSDSKSSMSRNSSQSKLLSFSGIMHKESELWRDTLWPTTSGTINRKNSSAFWNPVKFSLAQLPGRILGTRNSRNLSEDYSFSCYLDYLLALEWFWYLFWKFWRPQPLVMSTTFLRKIW